MYRQYCLHILKMIISKFVAPVSDWRSVTGPNETTLSGVITVSQLPAIIPTFDLIWKLMRQMWLGVKFFCGKPGPGMRIINGTYPFKFPLKAVKFQT